MAAMLDVSAGSQTVASITMSNSGSLNFGLGGGGDQLVLSEASSLGGTLDLNLLNGFTPSAGDVFDLFSGTTTGSFSQLNLPPLGGGLNWDTSDLYSAGEISVVPEPSTFVSFAAGALGLMVYARRRQQRKRRGF